MLNGLMVLGFFQFFFLMVSMAVRLLFTSF